MDPIDPDPPSRLPFEGWVPPPPFYRTPEFGRFMWIAGLLAFVGAFGFLRMRSSQPDAEQRTETVAAVVAPAPRAGEAAEDRARRISSAFEGALVDTHNGDDFKETQGFDQLVRILSRFSEGDMRKKSATALDHAAVMADPDAFRGDFLRARGLVAGMHTEKLQRPVQGVTDVYRAFLTDADGEHGIVIDLLEYPPDFEMRREAVEVFGLLYRTVKYENAAGKMVEAPYLLARNFSLVSENPTVRRTFLGDHAGVLLIASALAILATRLVMYVFQRNRGRRRPIRRGSANMREMMELKLREHGARVRRSSPTDPPPT